MLVSIIIPSYNACERLRLNLLSLNFQDCPKDLFEVIVIDNGSKDQTNDMLKHFKACFRMHVISFKENQERAFARNQGVLQANGDLIIFHDSDMIAEKSYVRNHVRYHDEKGIIVCGPGWKRIYSFYYKAFKGYTRENFIKRKNRYAFDNKKYYQYDKYPLLKESQIVDGSFLNACFELDMREKKLKKILAAYGDNLTGYHFPWRFFMTNNCSLEKQAVLDAGLFDEGFKGWGCEDIDLGYRLYKKGYRIVRRNHVISVHQEHPIDDNRPSKNIYYFTKKYEALDLMLFYYARFKNINDIELNEAYSEIEKLSSLEHYNDFLSVLDYMLKASRNCYAGNMPFNIHMIDKCIPTDMGKKTERCMALLKDSPFSNIRKVFYLLYKHLYKKDNPK